MKKLLENPIVKEVFEIFEGNEIFVVGGAVRDTMLGKDVVDIDFATKLLPDEVEQLAKENGYKTIPVGKHFGTIIIVLKQNKSEEVQITTYRRKEKYGENDRHPEVEYGTIVEEDLQRRDFTINAMAINNKKFAIVSDITTKTSTGLKSGRVIYQNERIPVAPSTLDASKISCDIPCNPAKKNNAQ